MVVLSRMSGMIPRIVNSLFEQIGEVDKNIEVTIKVMFVEIYLENIRDLLEPTSINLDVRAACEGVGVDDCHI